MKLSDIIKNMLHDFFVIVTGTLVCFIIFCSIFFPDDLFGIDSLIAILLFAAAGNLPTLILYSKKELSEKQWAIRTVIHFIVLEIVLLGFAVYLGWISNIYPHGILMCMLIAGVYLAVRFVGWKMDSKATSKINERLKMLKDDESQGH